MSFLTPDYFDRALPLSSDDRKEVRRQAWKRWFAQRVNLSLYIVVIAGINVTADLAWRGYRHGQVQTAWWEWVIAGTVFVIALYGALLVLQRWRFAPLAREVVREQGFNVCRRCGRWLRDEPPEMSACPHCGASLGAS